VARLPSPESAPAVGKTIGQKRGRHFEAWTLELGGKSATSIAEAADWEAAVDGALLETGS